MATDNLPINLESLLDLSAKLNASNDLLLILNSALLSLMGKLTILKGIVFIPDDTKTYFEPLISKGKFKAGNIDYQYFSEITVLDNPGNYEQLVIHGIKYIIPINIENDLIAIICLGSSLKDNILTEQELYYIKLVSIITANSIQYINSLKDLVKSKTEIEERNLLLSTMFEMNRDFSTLLTRNQIIKMMSLRLMGQLMVSRFAIYLYEGNKLQLIINRLGVPIEDTQIASLLIIEDTIDFQKIDNINDFDSRLQENINIVSPMKVQGMTKGLFLIGKKMNGASFTRENLLFIQALGSIAISSLENERLFQEEIEKKKLENELNLALEIQNNLFPKKIPKIPGYQYCGNSIPSRHVGGDYYDIITLPDGNFLIVIADVSGKGLPASLIMANLQAALRVLSTIDISLPELVNKLNKLVYQNTTPEKFVTFFCGILYPLEKKFKYINAGHNPPILMTSGTNIELLTKGGLILGITDESLDYSSDEVSINNGDTLVFYTDGVTEAKNTEDEDYTEQQLINIIIENNSFDSQELMDEIIKSVQIFQKGRNQYDDITLAILKAK